MKRGENSKISLYVLVLGIISVLAVCGFMVATHSIQSSEKQEGKVSLDSRTAIKPDEIPPIDKSVPSIIKSATFGLG